MLKTCFPGAYSGYLPYVVQHDPPTERSHATAITEDVFSEPVLLTNDIVKALIFQYGASIHGRNSEQNLCVLGEQLSSLGTLSPKHFEEVVRPILAQQIASRIIEAERYLRKAGESRPTGRTTCSATSPRIKSLLPTNACLFRPT